MMVELTPSLQHWLWKYHSDIIAPLIFGHIELFTDEMRKEYLDWCRTDEGKQYFEDGGKYVED